MLFNFAVMRSLMIVLLFGNFSRSSGYSLDMFSKICSFLLLTDSYLAPQTRISISNWMKFEAKVEFRHQSIRTLYLFSLDFLLKLFFFLLPLFLILLFYHCFSLYFPTSSLFICSILLICLIFDVRHGLVNK